MLPQQPALGPDPRQPVNIIEAQLSNAVAAINAEHREPVLLWALAVTRLEVGYEFVYNRIFGSQIAGLKRLNELGRATVDDA